MRMINEKEITKHWEICKLQEIGKVINGDRGKNYPSRAHYVETGIPFISAGNIEDNFIDTTNLNFITEEKFETLNNGKLKLGDIIYCLRGSLGKCAIFNLEKGAISSSLCILRLNDNMLGKFVYFYLNSPLGKNEILKHDNGTAQPNLSAKNFSNYIIFRPPLSEQQLIVSKIEQLLSELENGKQQLETARQQIKVYRQSLLKWAFEGKLTNDNIKEGELPKEWKWVKLGDIGEIVSGGTPSTKISEFWNGEISWITPADLSRYNNKIIKKGRKSISEKGLKHSSARLIPKGSVLFSSRAPIGYVVVAGNEVCTNQGFKSIIPNELISSNFLYYFLKASKNKVEKVASGTTFKEISLKNFSSLDFPLPSIKEQHLIVQELESKLTVCDKIEETITNSLQQAETLRQSILKKAFEGRLI